MSATKKALLEFFGLAAKDASPEELKALTENTVTVLDAEPAPKAPEAEPTKEPQKDEEIPKGDDLGAKLDKLLERLETIEKRINGHGGPAQDEEPAGEEAIDAELTKLAGTDEDGEGSTVLEEETTGDGCATSRDAAAILRSMRPVVAAISDEATKKAVTDALLASVRGSSSVADIQKATTDAAKKAAQDAGKTNYDKICEAQQSAYNARNPHIKKED